MTITSQAVWIDADYDLWHASNGVSRYGTYVRKYFASFTEWRDGAWDEALPVQFAAHAWRVAIGPVMVPGYVRYHPRILSTNLEHNYWDGSLLANVELITSWPRALTESADWMDATGKGRWHTWTEEDFGGRIYLAPTDMDISQHPYLMARACLCFSVPSSQLPSPPSASEAECELADRARQAVDVLVTELNQVLAPVIQAMEGSAHRSHT